jgi:hypothetical protein
MATIAGPRQSHPHHVRTLVDVPNSRTQIPLKRSPRRHVKQGATQPLPSLRDSYIAASVSAEQKLQALKNLPQLLPVSQDQIHSVAPETDMAPSSGYKRLSSGPSPASFSTSIAGNVPATGQDVELTETQSGVVASPVSLHICYVTHDLHTHS